MKKTVLFLLCIVSTALCINLNAETLEEKVARLEAQISALEAKTEATDSVITAEVVEPKKKLQPIFVKFDARFDWQSSFTHHADAKPDYASNFNGRYLMFMLDGNISPKFSYSLRYRMIHPNHENSWRGMFNATDWANLTYRPNKNWEITAGKMLVFYGSYEFDYNPLDVYMWSGWGGRVGCFQFGVLGKYITNDGRNNILFQINNSPFADPLSLGAMYSYSVQWNGNFGVFNALYSDNLIEYQPGRFINYIRFAFFLRHVIVETTFYENIKTIHAIVIEFTDEREVFEEVCTTTTITIHIVKFEFNRTEIELITKRDVVDKTTWLIFN